MSMFEPARSTDVVSDDLIEALLIDALREWYGGDRYARDYEYIDANYSDHMRRLLRYVLARIRAPITDAVATETPNSGAEDRSLPFSRSLGVTTSPAGREAEASPVISSDVARLVVAARIVAFERQDAEALRELDQASEAFAEQVPWDDAPAHPLPQGPVAETWQYRYKQDNAGTSWGGWGERNATLASYSDYVEEKRPLYTRPLGEAGDTDELVERLEKIANDWRIEAERLQIERLEDQQLMQRTSDASNATWEALHKAAIARAEAAESSLAAEAAQLQKHLDEADAATFKLSMSYKDQCVEVIALKQRVVELTAERDEARAQRISAYEALAAAEKRLDEAARWADGWQQACSTAEVLLGIGPCLAADEFPSAIQAYVAAAETQMRAKNEALVEQCAKIAEQTITKPITVELTDHNDIYTGNYETTNRTFDKWRDGPAIAKEIRALAPVTTPPAETGEPK